MNSRGATLVEFAILLPLLLILFLGITELGRALHFQHRLTRAVESGARYMARSFQTVDKTDPACDNTIGDWVGFAANAQNLVVFGTISGSGAPIISGFTTGDVDVAVAPRAVSGVGTACVITVSANVQYPGLFGAALIPLLDIPQPILGARSEERYVGS